MVDMCLVEVKVVDYRKVAFGLHIETCVKTFTVNSLLISWSFLVSRNFTRAM